MNRRFWTAALAVAALLVFGSYLAYTQYLVNEIRKQNNFHRSIYSMVQRGLLEEAGATLALFDMQIMLDSLGVPTVVYSPSGDIYGVRNLPFGDSLRTASDTNRVKQYAQQLERRNPLNKAEVPGAGIVYFGEPRLLAWLRWVPYLQVGGAVLLVLVAATMVRANVRAERERLWAAMARELAHQMGTPLSSLSGWLEVLALPEAERKGMASADHIAAVMQSDVERLERVSRRFELIGKPQALETVNIRDVVEELECYFRPRLPKLGRGIRLRSRVRGGIPAIRANRVLLAWALENVVKNAVDALAGRGGKILILAHAGGDGEVHVHVADDGPGIAPTVRERIFEPGVTTKSGGWGVGLSLTQRIVHELHGGRVLVRPRAGGGAIFDIVLPVEPEQRSRRKEWRS
ncbi:MAG: sensor histidine kinase [Longimicrobiales bacterium]